MHKTMTMCVLLSCAVASVAQKRSSGRVGVNSIDAPVPEVLLRAKRAFISYELGDVTAFPKGYSGGPERAYSEFYTEMKQWGRYQLVSDPADAEIIFGVRFVNPPEIAAQIRVGITDARTHVSLWGFVEQVDPAVRKKHRDASFTDSVDLLIGDIKDLVGANQGTGTTQP